MLVHRPLYIRTYLPWEPWYVYYPKQTSNSGGFTERNEWKITLNFKILLLEVVYFKKTSSNTVKVKAVAYLETVVKEEVKKGDKIRIWSCMFMTSVKNQYDTYKLRSMNFQA